MLSLSKGSTMNVVIPRPYFHVNLSTLRAITVDTGDSRGIVTVNRPVAAYTTSDGNLTIRGRNHTGTSVRTGQAGRILSIVTSDGLTHVV